ncbi:hypothetical protein [Nannocystis radixulma]|uniref:hypothetical protein n=1 Tax=Nannocystis radixulma TaxID=2995305 RepID=UPI00232C97C3|nr:hypothetical protein [Nannocystis radixulma]
MRLPGELRRARLCALARRHAELAWRLDTWLSGQLDEAARAEVAAARQAAVGALAAALATAPGHAEVIALGVPESRAAAPLYAGLEPQPA